MGVVTPARERLVSVANFLKPELNFRRVPTGWVFRGPNPLLIGESPHYLVSDEQKLRIMAAIRSTAAVLPISFIIGFVVAIVAFPNADDTAVMFFIMAAILVCLSVTALIQREVLKPILAGASPTNERITNAEVRKADEDSTPPEQVRRRWVVPAVACALFALQVTLNWDRPPRAILSALGAFVFGWQAVRWYLVSGRSRSSGP